jgi:hypothetical protein
MRPEELLLAAEHVGQPRVFKALFVATSFCMGHWTKTLWKNSAALHPASVRARQLRRVGSKKDIESLAFDFPRIFHNVHGARAQKDLIAMMLKNPASRALAMRES